VGIFQLARNQISDIEPLIKNSGLQGPGFVDLTGNPLSITSIEVYIPQLVNRGVGVDW
jgi:hypothetical protein